jgi:hypothetical protein
MTIKVQGSWEFCHESSFIFFFVCANGLSCGWMYNDTCPVEMTLRLLKTGIEDCPDVPLPGVGKNRILDNDARVYE